MFFFIIQNEIYPKCIYNKTIQNKIQLKLIH